MTSGSTGRVAERPRTTCGHRSACGDRGPVYRGVHAGPLAGLAFPGACPGASVGPETLLGLVTGPGSAQAVLKVPNR